MKTNYTIRAFDATDLPNLFTLVRSRPAGRELDFPSLADLRELMDIESMREATHLWMAADGRLAGFAILERGETYAELSMNIAAGEDNETILAEMIAWAEEVFRERYDGKATGVQTSVEETNTERIMLLERHGFTRQDMHTLLLERNLSEPIPSPVIPEGFSLRSLSGDEESAWVDLHQAAFGTQNMTLDWRQAITRAPDYDAALDLVAAAPDGSLAAYVYGSISREENELSGRKIGYTDPVGTHPDYQRRGLCRALLLECLRRLRERRMDTARLSTGSWDTAMQRAALSAGFLVLSKKVWFKKEYRT